VGIFNSLIASIRLVTAGVSCGVYENIVPSELNMASRDRMSGVSVMSRRTPGADDVGFL